MKNCPNCSTELLSNESQDTIVCFECKLDICTECAYDHFSWHEDQEDVFEYFEEGLYDED